MVLQPETVGRWLESTRERMNPPKMTLLPGSGEVPIDNLRRPPTRYTHRVMGEQPYFYEPRISPTASGTFDAGTRVALIAESGPLCRVVDSRGLFVYTKGSGLEKLATTAPGKRKD